MDLSHNSSNKITILSFIAAWMVVLIHSNYWLPSAAFSTKLYLNIVGSGICGFAVPFFFIVSGWFFMKHFDGSVSWWWHEIRKRTFSLMIPYVIWATLTVLIVKILLGRGPVCPLADFGITTVTPYNGSLWYVKVLFLMAIFSPIFIMVVKRIEIKGAIVLFGLGAVLLGIPVVGFKTYFRAAYWFSMGLWLASGGGTVLHRLSTRKSLIGTTVLWCCVLALQCIFEWNRFWLYVPVVSVPWIWLMFSQICCKLESVGWHWNHRAVLSICHTSFFIYCSHAIVKDVVAIFFAPSSILSSIAFSLVVFSSCAVLALLLRSVLPVVYAFLTGGRLR